jgi:hypothetical protein
MKKCIGCKETKPLNSFHRRITAIDGRLNLCKECNCLRVRKWNAKNKPSLKNKNLITQYGINLKEYNDFKVFCDYKCSICGCHESKYSRQLAVDHDHKTGTVRGLLCIKCNKGLGLFEDNIELLKSAINYLECYQEVYTNAINTGQVEQCIQEQFKN